MREIKFRVWNNRTGKVRSCMDMKWFNNGNMRVNATEDENNYEPLLYMKDYEGKKLQEFVLMQYTGLKDIDEQEIYEGDILQELEPCFEWEGIEKRFVVEWLEDECGFGFKRLNTTIYENSADLMDEGGIVLLRKIGNIYENAKLLEVG